MVTVSNRFAMNWVLITLLLWPRPGHAEERPLMQITTTIDFGQDVGQNWGSLFEARTRRAAWFWGRAFAGVYNTAFRMDRFTLQFFVRDDEAEETFETLPPSTEDGGSYLFDLDGRVYSCSYHQDRTARWWDDEAGAWQVDESFGVGETVAGDGKDAGCREDIPVQRGRSLVRRRAGRGKARVRTLSPFLLRPGLSCVFPQGPRFGPAVSPRCTRSRGSREMDRSTWIRR